MIQKTAIYFGLKGGRNSEVPLYGKQRCHFIPVDTQSAANNAVYSSVKFAINAQFALKLSMIAYRFSLRIDPCFPFYCADYTLV